MNKARLETFSDGVIAIIITIMVLEMKVPHTPSIEALIPLIPIFISYVLSFIYIGIYWNNHHHMLQAVHTIHGGILWANSHLLFWLSLIPFVTSWMGENHFDKWPVALYGVVLFMNAIAYTILAKMLVKHHGKDSTIARAVGTDTKGKISLILYALGIAISFFSSWISLGLYVIVAIIWIVPDKRIENKLAAQ